MKQSKTSKYAYTAGIIDGDGSIQIAIRNPRNGRSLSYGLLVVVLQKDGRIPDWLVGNFGGTIYKKRYPNELTIYQWRLTDRKAHELLKRIIPFLVYKKDQAMTALQLASRIGNSKDSPQKPLSENEIKIRTALYRKIKSQKKIWLPSKYCSKIYNFNVAAVETKREDSSIEENL